MTEPKTKKWQRSHKHSKGATIIELRSDTVCARFSTVGGQLLRYQQGGQQPLLWVNDQAIYEAGQATREGIPLCWPWFGDIKRNPETINTAWSALESAPAHGLVRQTLWEELPESKDYDIAFRCETQCPAAPGESAITLRLELRYQLLPKLQIEVHSTRLPATSATPSPAFPLSLALHSYFAISDVSQVRIDKMDSLTYLDSTEGWQEKRQAPGFPIEGEVDRVFPKVPNRIELLDQGWQRRICLETEGLPSAVVWNPGTARSSSISQFTPESYRDMLCIENAALLDHHIQLKSGETHLASLRIFTTAL